MSVWHPVYPHDTVLVSQAYNSEDLQVMKLLHGTRATTWI